MITKPPPADAQLISALIEGDETAFEYLIDTYQASLVRVAMFYVNDRAIAEDVVQDTWIGVLHGIKRFEGRSSLKTWIFSILTNRAKARAEKEGRHPAIAFGELETDEPAVEPDRFQSEQDAYPGHWKTGVDDWDAVPEAKMLSAETLAVVDSAIEALPENQKAVIRLHDIDGLTAQEICNILDLSETNQRVLLHRARSKVRRALEGYLKG